MQPLSPADQMILNSYIPVLEGLANYLSDAYELVLHSLADYEHSVICIFNGEHTGRRPGAPITDLALKMLQTIEEDQVDSIVYFTQNRAGEPLKSTTIAIRGEHDAIIGLLCINLYLNTPILDFAGSLVSMPESPFSAPVSEFFAQDTSELVLNAFEEEKQRVELDRNTTSGKYNKLIIEALEARGIFQIKNAVGIIAEQLDISRNTVYMHLRKIRS